MFPDADLSARTMGLLAAGAGLYMLALACAQALIALGGHRDQAIGWFLGLVALMVTVWLGPDDLFLRVEVGLLVGSAWRWRSCGRCWPGGWPPPARSRSTRATSSRRSTTSPIEP